MTTFKEIWQPVRGWEKTHCVSNMGNVKSLKRTIKGKGENNMYVIPERMMKSNSVGAGYMGLVLGANGTKTRFLLHRLVAQNFIPNPENKPCVNHIDGNKLNNRINNLEWVTYQENAIHGHKTGLFPTKITQDEASQIRQLYSTGKHKQSEIGKMFDLTQGTVGKIVRNEIWVN